jgi:hypothetical protein
MKPSAFSPIAWTGGDRPGPYASLSLPEKKYVSGLFKDQIRCWKNYWQGGENPPWDTLRIFYKRARYDAHATFRDATNH